MTQDKCRVLPCYVNFCHIFLCRLEITNRRKLRTDSEKLGEVLRLWKTCHPEEYNVATLLHVLDIMVTDDCDDVMYMMVMLLCLQGMKSMYEWVELMTKERLDLDGVENYVSRCNTPHMTRSRSHTPHSQYWTNYHTHQSMSPAPSDQEDLNSSFSHSNSSCSPPIRPKQNHSHRHSSPSGGVFSTLYKPDHMLSPPNHSTPIKVSQYNTRNPTSHNNKTKSGQSTTTQLRKLSHRHSSYIAPLITLDTGTPTPGTGILGIDNIT